MSVALQVAAEITGIVQQAVEKLHELRTYHLSSATCLRHELVLNEVRDTLTVARNRMAGLALVLGKERV